MWFLSKTGYSTRKKCRTRLLSTGFGWIMKSEHKEWRQAAGWSGVWKEGLAKSKSLQRWSTSVLCTIDQERALRRLIGSFLALCWQIFTQLNTSQTLSLSLLIFKYSYSNSVIWRDAYIIILTCAVGPNNGIFCKVLVSAADNLQKVENSTILSIGSFVA